MDAVITYVDGNDPVWRQDYLKYVGDSILTKRFRDWATLKYLLRGIETNMPFIRNVYLVVSHRSQVPEWVDMENLRVVLHSDFIPQEYLPTFNSNAIEMHLHRIPGLDEEFLYFNDDMFPVAPCRETDFFRDGKSVIYFSRHYLASGMYKKICRNSDRLARKILGMPEKCWFVRPQHICSPMQKSESEKVYSKAGEWIGRSSTRIRTEDNCTQYLFLDYLYYSGKAISEKLSNKHFSVFTASAGSLVRFIVNPSRNLVCINDVHVGQKRYEKLRAAVLDAFERRFPEKSRFEL
ncbi:MAG: hypothetical protein K2O58_09045 [Bacteroidales bacterium]|nr:hypothetical protein [Bacteroidales bacterium]MDE7128018.1 hypothetical protein [Bacteroidales bacterium]